MLNLLDAFLVVAILVVAASALPLTGKLQLQLRSKLLSPAKVEQMGWEFVKACSELLEDGAVAEHKTFLRGKATLLCAMTLGRYCLRTTLGKV